MRIETAYLTPAFVVKHRKLIIREAVSALRKVKSQFDTIAVCGTSGLLVGPTIADRLGKSLMVVRKEPQDEPSHSWLRVEGRYRSRFIIVDDFVSTGRTVQYMLKQIKEADPASKLAGLYFYKPRHRDEGQNGEELEVMEIVPIGTPIFSDYPTENIWSLNA